MHENINSKWLFILERGQTSNKQLKNNYLLSLLNFCGNHFSAVNAFRAIQPLYNANFAIFETPFHLS